MRRLLLISLATIPLTGCQFFNKGSDVAVIDPLDPASGGEVIAAQPDGAAADAGSEAFSDPTVASAKTSVSADLIQSTNANARTLKVQRSRNDPFATLPIPPPPEPAELPVGAAGNGGASSQNVSGGGTSFSGGRNGSSNSSSSSGNSSSGRATTYTQRAPAVSARAARIPPPVRVQPANRPLVIPSPIAALPRVPQPVIAQTVSVSGVIQLGNEPYAILRSGSEPERYARVGDRIAGGSVRVKRIETLAFEPRVILEENGIEVSRPITASVDTASSGSRTAPSTSSVPVPAATPPVIPGGQALLPGMPNLPTPPTASTL